MNVDMHHIFSPMLECFGFVGHVLFRSDALARQDFSYFKNTDHENVDESLNEDFYRTIFVVIYSCSAASLHLTGFPFFLQLAEILQNSFCFP